MSSYLDIMPGGLVVFSDEGIIKRANETFCRLLHFDPSELEGYKLEMVLTVASRIFFQTHLFPLLKMQGFASEIFMGFQTKEKEEVPVLLNAKKGVDASEYVCIFMPVYNRLKYEEEILRARRTAEQALKENTELLLAKKQLQEYAEALDARMVQIERQHGELKQFSRVVTHDLQEPLRKMKMFASYLETARNPDPASVEKIIHKLYDLASQMKNILLGLQQYVWLNDVETEIKEVNISRLLLLASQQLSSEFGPDLLELHAAGLPNVKGHWEQLNLLVYHLLSNSIKYRKPGEKAVVHIRCTLLQENTFRKTPDKYRYEDYLRIEFQDEGIGFDTRYKEEIFGLFRRLHNASGSGLGLALCKKIVENHGGFISADSRAGNGSCFTILLPAHAQVKIMDKRL